MDGVKLISTMDIKIKDITDFKTLVAYLCDVLGWPIDPNSKEDDITFEYDPEELGIVEEDGKNTLIIKQLRPPKQGWPWGIFYIDFTKSRLPVVLLRRTLKQFVEKKRNQSAHQAVWKMQNLIFVCFFGSDEGRSTSIVYFIQHALKLPLLKVIAWDQYDTDRHIEAVEKSLLKLSWPTDLSSINDWENQWGSAFQLEHRYVIKTSKQLSFELAKCASRIRKYVLSAFKIERETGPLHMLYNDFKKILIHDLADTDFADMYAQTIAYGLFSARCMDDDGHFELAEIVERIPETNPFLKNLLHQCMGFRGASKDKMDLEELGVDELVELLDAIDMKAIQDDFGRQRKGEDPVIHLYEGFMNEYDKKQKVRRGEFYTPDPVVSFIVRAVDTILMDKFGCRDGLADKSTWGELVEKGIIKRPEWAQHHNSKEWKALSKEPFIQILDPATGTGTFLKYVILQIYKNFMESIHEKVSPSDFKQRWNEYVQKNLLPRLNGFELKMAPYAVAHMKVGMVLHEKEYEFREKKRLNVFMTNTLEEPHEYAGTLFAQFLAKESELAAQVKKETPITIIIGNPPYSSFGKMNRGKWILSLLDDYKEGLEERKINLDDDFIKFIRFAQWKLSKTGFGIVAMITSNTFLDGLTHRQMRKNLMEIFDEIYIYNLHGSMRKNDVCPDGSKDENVFDIQQGVSINIFIKYSNKAQETTLHYRDLWGNRQYKFDVLAAQGLNTCMWKVLNPRKPNWFFVEKSERHEVEYQNFRSINKIFRINSVGILTSRDDFVYDHDRKTLAARVRDFLDLSITNEELNKKYNLRDNTTISLKDARKEMVFNESDIRQSNYRLFDKKYLYYSKYLLHRTREEVQQNLLHDNLALLSCRQEVEECFRHIFCVNFLVDDSCLSNRSRERGYVFPLYLYSSAASKKSNLFDNHEKVKNIDNEFVKLFAIKIGLMFIDNKKGDLKISFGPEDIFYYAYAIFHCPTYRERYAEQLKIDFPRLPLISDKELFCSLVEKGNKLVNLHLLGENPFDKRETIFGQPNTWNIAHGGGAPKNSDDWKVADVHYDELSKRVYINSEQYFEGVEKQVWEFIIGSYQVCEKWLKDRKKTGRSLSKDDIEHYMKIVVAIRETIHLMKEIDETINSYGGFPEAFA